MTQSNERAAVAVLSAHTQFLERQLADLTRSSADGFRLMSDKLDRVGELYSEVRVITERLESSNSNVTRAHTRIDRHDERMAELERTKNRWRGAFIGAQLLSGALLALTIYVANGYVAEIRDISDRLFRLERGLSQPPVIEAPK